jgi:2-polyprenyl-3-methyl-5-hydroxy-6-metoxy-1,4-benzoquinol methylase
MKSNTCLHPNHYAELTEELALIDAVQAQVNGVIHHEHRRWEYGLALSLLTRYRENGIENVLDIGSGASPFPVILAQSNFSVEAVDPANTIQMQSGYAQLLNRAVVVRQQDIMSYAPTEPIDAITCLSVLEHVEDDAAFVQRMCSFKPMLIICTVDFHPSGQAFRQPDHLRTYTASRLKELAALGKPYGYKLIGVPDWTYTEDYVHEYSFASLVLKAE